MASDWEGVSIALADTMFTVSPTWTRVDTMDGCRVSEVSIQRGRQSEFDRTDTGKMSVVINDVAGVFDPTNTASPIYGELISKPIAFAVRDPVADEWWPRFRGVVEEIAYDLHPSQKTGVTTITCVDMIEYLSNFELAPGLAGDAGGPDGYVFYDDTDWQTRVTQILADAGIPSGLYSVFTGNVDVQECLYSPGEKLMSAILEALEAEFPTVANGYVDKYGFFVAHGRNARFDPDGVSATATHWDFNRWKIGDGAAILLDSDRAQARPPFHVVRSRSRVFNAALAYPFGIAAADIQGQVLTEPGSIATHGTRSWSSENIKVLAGTTTGLDANGETLLYSTYVIENYSEGRNRVESLTLRSLRPDDVRAAKTWAMICRVDISDVVNLRIDHPGGGGFNENFYVEGVRETHKPLVRDLDTGYPNVEMNLDLSPSSYWALPPS